MCTVHKGCFSLQITSSSFSGRKLVVQKDIELGIVETLTNKMTFVGHSHFVEKDINKGQYGDKLRILP